VACFERAVAADPASTEGWFWLAVTRDNRGQGAEAVPAYRQTLRLGIDDRNQRAQAWTWLVSSLPKTGRHPEALDALTKAVRLGGYEPKGEFGRLRVAIGHRAMRAQRLTDKDRSGLRGDDSGAARVAS
jgi:cytochrome c-type biogenesis protein CcmH/NrfG